MPNIQENIVKTQPFECDDWDELCSAIIDVYDICWGISLVWTLGCIRWLKGVENGVGSWNIPMWKVATDPHKEIEVYKVFIAPELPVYGSTILPQKEIFYEFHQEKVLTNKWLKAELSGSAGLTGLENPDHARFHMLIDKNQAEFYLDSRIETQSKVERYRELYKDCYPFVHPVKARNFTTVDLIYVPPISFMWGIDAKEMYVHYE